jgi:pseudouridine-5'-phosphate glycosidase
MSEHQSTTMTSPTRLRIADTVRRALGEGTAVVALESTVIAHGLPRPLNLETALACETAVGEAGATPATIGIIDGLPIIGLSEGEISQFATRVSPDGSPIEKVGLNNLASVMANGGWGATTVASSVKLAHAAGIRVFSTGGIGGVHRGASDTFDVSADLTALGSTPLVCVCAGAKAILDLPKTVEHLETLGVPILGYRTAEFPAFYSRSSALGVDSTVGAPEEAAAIARLHWEAGSSTAVLVCVPVPGDFEVAREDVENAIDRALVESSRQGIRGKAVTPFLLAELEKLSGGKTLAANRALLVNNASVAASIAVKLTPNRES